jgi:hypothetical protein
MFTGKIRFSTILIHNKGLVHVKTANYIFHASHKQLKKFDIRLPLRVVQQFRYSAIKGKVIPVQAVEALRVARG